MSIEVFPLSGLREGTFVGRVWWPEEHAGPVPVLLNEGGVYDLSAEALTLSALLERADIGALRQHLHVKRPICSIRDLLDGSCQPRKCDAPVAPYLLAPSDLQVIKACGVTFAKSLLERVVEERTRGNPKLAEEVRRTVEEDLSSGFSSIIPGSKTAADLKRRLEPLGLWSQYLEVGLGSDAELFTKAPPLAAVGCYAEIGILQTSHWNNPEPELVLAVNSRGEIVGATLGNDVNLRDLEGRSALLLGKAKDNNGSCAIGPAIRLFDETFSLDDVREMQISLEITGHDGFHLQEHGSVSEISRDPAELVRQTIGAHHQYPDGFMLFLGSMFAPTRDRDTPGLGFTHHIGDRVVISAPQIGALVNDVNYSDAIPPWTFGLGELFRYLLRRDSRSVS